ncbi:MAG: hypothetical protein RLZ98_152 [Pseudomonadota bacterium]|jgi:thiosulfate reductase cytochrome b subunit
MGDYWFKPKSYGYGASPASWKGWAATLGFIVVSLVPTLVLIVWPAVERAGPQAWHFAIWFVLTTALALGFVWLCKVKTEGEWRWRWGE